MSIMNFQAPAAGQTFATRGGTFISDANGLIFAVPVSGSAIPDLLASGCIPVTSSPLATFRNMLDGGDFTVNPWQRNGTALGSGNIIATPITNTATYFPDRWFGVGGSSSSLTLAQVADTTVAGFSQSCLMARSTGSNTAPLQFGHVVETLDCIRLQNNTVTLSFWARAGSSYSGGALTVQLITGTGTNQSAANMVAGSWTNQANLVNASQVINTAMTRYSFSAVVPAASTQLGVLITWTPSGTAGSQDGVFFNGLQLEAGGLSPFEHRDVQVELEICQRYAWAIPEPTSGASVAAGCASASNVQIYYMATPVQMIKAPTVTTVSGTFKMQLNGVAIGSAVASGTLTSVAHSPNSLTISGNATSAAVGGCLLSGGGGAGYILATSDF
jgi:hypothetical protein